MKKLAEKIGNDLDVDYSEFDMDDENDFEEFECMWYTSVEKCAINMGMKYYDELTNEEYEKYPPGCNHH